MNIIEGAGGWGRHGDMYFQRGSVGWSFETVFRFISGRLTEKREMIDERKKI